MENSYCLVFQHPVSQEITMLPAAPKPLPRWRWRYAQKVIKVIVKYCVF